MSDTGSPVTSRHREVVYAGSPVTSRHREVVYVGEICRPPPGALTDRQVTILNLIVKLRGGRGGFWQNFLNLKQFFKKNSENFLEKKSEKILEKKIGKNFEKKFEKKNSCMREKLC